ncbi:MAG TPA: hypothetical protein PLV72_00080 [Candidatus Magasanikbacteria bacterium]|nr:hypothetical protein [Candidatus Magasanikbacteria bacterium]
MAVIMGFLAQFTWFYRVISAELGGLILLTVRLLMNGPDWIGVIGFGIFVFANACVWRRVVSGIWRERLTERFSLVYGIILELFVLSSFYAVFILNGHLYRGAIFGGFVFAGAIAHFFYERLRGTYLRGRGNGWGDEKFSHDAETPWSLFGRNSIWLVLFVLLWGVGLYFLTRTVGTDSYQTPWQLISRYYLPIFFGLTLVVGIILVSKFPTSIVIFYLIAQSLLMHWYLPATHVLPWGGDVWRHVAAENRYLRGDYVLPVLFGPDAKWGESVGIDLPETILIPHKFAYAQFWGVGVAFSDTLGISPIVFNKYFMPILWPFVFTLLLYRLGLVIFGRRRAALLLAAGGVTLFSFQANGGFTLPNPFAFLFYLTALITHFAYLRDREVQTRRAIWLFSLSMILVYPLYALIYWMGLLVAFVLQKISIIRNVWKYGLVVAGVMTFGVCLVPMIDLFSGLSRFPSWIELGNGMKQAGAIFSGWLMSRGIMNYDIEGGNILFNQPPLYAYVANYFSVLRIVLPAVLVLFWSTAVIGFWRAWRSRDLVARMICWLVVTAVGGYLTGFFVLQGDRLFARRLDLLFAFTTAVLFLFGAYYLFNLLWRKFLHKFPRFVISIGVIIVIVGWALCTVFTYGMGPDMRVAATADVEFANQIVADRKISERDCVLADTWPLLVLEGVSGRDIVGGGFPMEYNYGQKERVALYFEITTNPTTTTILMAQKLTGAENCRMYLPRNSQSFSSSTIDSLLGKKSLVIGDNLLY